MQFRNVDKKKLILVVLSVIIMGFSLSFLNKTNLGTDPCTMFNLGISSNIGISLGTWQALFNCVLFLFVLAFDRSQIGWGTLANMFLVGYSFDFFTWLNGLWIPDVIYAGMTARILITIPALFVFIIAASTYMAVQLGTSPYDALPFIIASRVKKIPFKVIRIIWDVVICVTGYLLGSTLGIVSVIMAFALGPVISWVRKKLVVLFGFENWVDKNF